MGKVSAHKGFELRHALQQPVVQVALMGVGTVAVLGVDTLQRSVGAQIVLGTFAFALLLVLSARCSPTDRRAIWACVGLATLVEVFASVIWGVYRYRLHNVPLYVPPGHGFVYLMSLRLSRTHLFTVNPARTRRISVSVALALAVLGLTLEPLLIHRVDIMGAFWCMYFVCFSLRTSRYTFFAAVFVVTSALELLGTGLGTWAWQATDPVLGMGSGNPPSVVAGGYCVIEAMAIVAGRGIARLARRRRAPAAGGLAGTLTPDRA